MVSRKFRLAGGILILVMVMAGGFICTGEETGEIIARVEKKAAAIESYRADLTMTIDMMGKEMTSSGTMIFKKPNKSWMETVTDIGTMNMKQIFVSDGKIAWVYQPVMKMVTKVDLTKVSAEMKNLPGGQQISGDISKPLRGLNEESIAFVRTEKFGGDEVYVFQGSPRETAMKQQVPFVPSRLELWIGADDGLVRKMIVFSEEGKKIMSQSYTNIEKNIKVPDSKFEFTPPEGVQVMDMTEGSINMMKGTSG